MAETTDYDDIEAVKSRLSEFHEGSPMEAVYPHAPVYGSITWLRKDVKTLLAECRRAVAVGPESGWRPIETAPKNGVAVLCYAPADHGLPSLQAVVTWHQDAGWCVDELREVTHWMPLPPAPKENSRE
jgi:hypothetical protein